MSEIQTSKIYQSLSAYGLLPVLRERIATMRANKKKPSRDTVWNAFQENEGGSTPLQGLILEQGKILLQEHENEVMQVLEPA
jgi:hypothetical protein